jgi:hypothetical protein
MGFTYHMRIVLIEVKHPHHGEDVLLCRDPFKFCTNIRAIM